MLPGQREGDAGDRRPDHERRREVHRCARRPAAGVASDTKQSGTSMMAPHMGPRSHQRSGQTVTPTRNPMVQRATYQAQTATTPLNVEDVELLVDGAVEEAREPAERDAEERAESGYGSRTERALLRYEAKRKRAGSQPTVDHPLRAPDGASRTKRSPYLAGDMLA